MTRSRIKDDAVCAKVAFRLLDGSILIMIEPGETQHVITTKWDVEACRCDLLLDDARRSDGSGFDLWQVSQRVLAPLIFPHSSLNTE